MSCIHFKGRDILLIEALGMSHTLLEVGLRSYTSYLRLEDDLQSLHGLSLTSHWQ